jgi:hypothetical protein
MLQFFSASTNTVNSKKAITECLEKALGNENSLDCDLIIMYSAVGHNFKDLLSEARKLSPSARIAGATFNGIIGKEGPDESMKALAIMAVKGGKDEFALAVSETIVDCDLYEMGSQLAHDLKSQNPHINMIHFIPSGIDVFPAEKAIEGIESVFGPDVPIFGGTSSDNFKGISDFQFLDDRIFERGALMIGFADPSLRMTTYVNHGFKLIGMPFEVTRAEANRIYEFNGQPAWKFLMDTLGLPETSHWIEVALVGQLAEELPADLHKEYGSTHILRCAMGNYDDNSIISPITLKKGTRLRLTERDEEGIFEGVDLMVNRVLKDLNGRKPLAVFHTDCATRGKRSFERILKDEIVSRMQDPICGDENIPWIGAYGYAEIAMLGGKNRFHQFTSALYIIQRDTHQ